MLLDPDDVTGAMISLTCSKPPDPSNTYGSERDEKQEEFAVCAVRSLEDLDDDLPFLVFGVVVISSQFTLSSRSITSSRMGISLSFLSSA
jgi:hypothetical protein